MHYATIKKADIANGPGVRVSVFVSGCRNNCPGCFNQEAQDFSYGSKFTDVTARDIVRSLSASYVDGLSILGGEPLEPENQPYVLLLIHRAKGAQPNKSIWLYTGFQYEDLIGDKSCRANTPIASGILDNIDVLVDGRFEQGLYQPGLKFRGSTNQRLIDTQQTRLTGEIVLWDK